MSERLWQQEAEQLKLAYTALDQENDALRAQVAALREALTTIADGREVHRGGHTEMEDISDPSGVARAALEMSGGVKLMEEERDYSSETRDAVEAERAACEEIIVNSPCWEESDWGRGYDAACEHFQQQIAARTKL